MKTDKHSTGSGHTPQIHPDMAKFFESGPILRIRPGAIAAAIAASRQARADAIRAAMTEIRHVLSRRRHLTAAAA